METRSDVGDMIAVEVDTEFVVVGPAMLSDMRHVRRLSGRRNGADAHRVSISFVEFVFFYSAIQWRQTEAHVRVKTVQGR